MASQPDASLESRSQASLHLDKADEAKILFRDFFPVRSKFNFWVSFL
jgi:hypothetical protein